MKKVLLIVTILIIFTAEGALAVRPLTTDDAGTVDIGKWEIEGGAEWDQPQGGANRSISLGTSIKYGILPNGDLGIEIPYAASGTKGLGDATVKGKIRFIEESESAAAIAARLDIKLANGDANQGLGSGYTDYGLFCILSKELGAITGHFNLGYTIVGVAAGSPANNILSYGGALEYPLNEKANLMGEIAGSSSTGSTPLDLVIGINHFLNETLIIDGGLTLGLNNDSSQYKVTAGVTANL